MKYLIRSIRMSFKYRWSLIGAIICSFLVALAWGANIGAVYPFVEIVFEGQSVPQWVDKSIADANESINTLNGEIDELERQRPTTKGKELVELERQISLKQSFIESHTKKREFSEKIQPSVERFAPETPFGTLVAVVAFLLGSTILRGLFLMGNMVLVARVGQRTVLDLQNLFLRNTMDLDLTTIGEQGTGDLVGRIRGETGAIGGAITMLFGKTLREPLKMAACLAGAAIFNWRLLLLSLIISPIAAYIMLCLTKSIKRANKKAYEESARLMNRLLQSVTYIKVVKAYTMEKHEQRKFRNTANEVYKKGMKISIYGSLFRMNNELLGVGIISLSILAGGYLVLNQETHLFGIRMCDTPMTLGEIMAFYAFLVGVSDPIRKMGDVYNALQTGLVAAERVYPLVDRESKVVEPDNPQQLPAGPATVEFRGVDFAYTPDKPILKDISFRLQAGQSLAIVGANGSGKSTLVNLLPRFYDPDQGEVVLDGRSIDQFRKRDLRKYIGYVTQQTMLFDDSISENIRYGTPGATQDQVVEAAKKAHAHRFITENLDEEYESRIGEHGGLLSGGQRQRISLARAILRNPQLLILDEATSQIDPESEMLIHRTLSEFIKNRTAIMITHRLSTLDLADLIMVMEEGNIVGLGTHDELLRTCDIYQRLRHNDLRESA